MLTLYERSQLEIALDSINAGGIPPNLEQLGCVLEHLLRVDRQSAVCENIATQYFFRVDTVPCHRTNGTM